MDHRVGCDVRRVLAVALFEEIDAAALTLRELLEVPYVHAKLLDGARAERVSSSDENTVVVLQKKEGNLGEVGRFTDAVDADNGKHIRATRGVDGLDFAKEIEGGGRCENLGEGLFHGGADGGFDG